MGCCCIQKTKTSIKIINEGLITDENELFQSRLMDSPRVSINSPMNNSFNNDRSSMCNSRNSFNNSQLSNCNSRSSFNDIRLSCCNNSNTLNIEKGVFVVHKTTNINDDYVIGDPLGIGGLGSVRIATHRPTKQDRAIKAIAKSSLNLDMTLKSQFFNEVDILRQIDHPNIVKLYEFYEDEKNYYLVMELLKGGDLFSYLIKDKNITEQSAAFFFKQLLTAVAYCHSKGIVHRDLKPDHLLLESNTRKSALKIIDFATSAFFQPSKRLTRKYGTTYYIAPEVFSRSYTEKCDIWSCGVILYLLLAGTPPFDGNTENEIIGKIIRGKISFAEPIWEKISNEAKAFIKKMIQADEVKRISAEEALNDIWIRKNSEVFFEGGLSIQPLFTNLKKFHANQKLQQSVLTFIATQLLNKEETRELSEVFRAMDTNSDGKIAKEELLKEYKKTKPLLQAQDEVEKIMNEVDIDKSGYIDYTEFLIASMKKDKLLSRRNLENSFRIFDRDNSGTITISELQFFLGNDTIGSKAAWNNIMKSIDINNDGELDMNEFKALVFKIFE